VPAARPRGQLGGGSGSAWRPARNDTPLDQFVHDPFPHVDRADKPRQRDVHRPVDIALGLAGGILLLSLHNLETDTDDTRRYRQIGHAARQKLQLHNTLIGTAATNLLREDLRPSLRQMTWRSSLDGEFDVVEDTRSRRGVF
jgi:hypothetical protein